MAFEVAIGQAALGGSLSGSASVSGRCKFGHGLELHVAVLELPLVVLLEQHGADQADDRASLGKMPTTSARRLTSLFRRSSGLVLCSLVRCCAGKAM